MEDLGKYISISDYKSISPFKKKVIKLKIFHAPWNQPVQIMIVCNEGYDVFHWS